jgi:hypothetical protein
MSEACARRPNSRDVAKDGRDVRRMLKLRTMPSSTCAGAVSFSRIFVGGVPRGTTEEQLRQAFASVGTEVGAIEFVVDRSTGAQRGFAFIDLGKRIFSATDTMALVRLRAAAIDGRAFDIQGIPEWPGR